MLPYQIFLFILCLNTKTSFQVEYFFTGASGGSHISPLTPNRANGIPPNFYGPR